MTKAQSDASFLGKLCKRARMIEDLSFLIGMIYDASIDPARWQWTLSQIALFLETSTASLMIEDADAKHIPSIFMSFSDPEWVQTYLDKYILLNPVRIASAAYAKAGDIILTKDFMTQDEYERTRFYREWLSQRDFVDNPVAIIDRSPSDFTIFAMHRNRKQGPADETLRSRLALLIPHLTRAVGIARALERNRLEALTFAEVLSNVSSAIVLVDSAGRVVLTNQSAREHLASGAVLRTAQNILKMHDARASAALDAAITSAGDAGAAPDKGVITIPLKSLAGDRFLASVLPLKSGVRSEIGNHFHAIAAVFVRKIGIDLPIDPMPIARSFDLTPRELTVMITVVESGGVPETGAILGLSESTLRTHLQSIYRKTGVRNQPELAKLVVGAQTGLR